MPGLATVLVGDDPASAVYVRMKREDCAEVGIESFHHDVPGDVAPGALARLLGQLNEDERVHGILLQLPLPDHLDQDDFISLIDPGKDVDGLTAANAGLLMQDREEAMVPVHARRRHGAAARGGREPRGRPRGGDRPVDPGRQAGGAAAARRQRHRDALPLAHARPRRGLPRGGRAGRGGRLAALVTADMVREGAVVIDVGTNRTDDGLVGDVDFDAVRERAGAITPVPGGVGPMTRAMLLVNTLRAARQVRLALPRHAGRPYCAATGQVGTSRVLRGVGQAIPRSGPPSPPAAPRCLPRAGGGGASPGVPADAGEGPGTRSRRYSARRMDLRRLRLGEWLTAVSGGALLLSLFVPWYGSEPPATGSSSAWEALAVIDVALALVAACGVLLSIVTATQRVPAVPIALSAVVTLFAILGAVLVLVRALDLPGGVDGPRVGAWLGLAGTPGSPSAVCSRCATSACLRAVATRTSPAVPSRSRRSSTTIPAPRP